MSRNLRVYSVTWRMAGRRGNWPILGFLCLFAVTLTAFGQSADVISSSEDKTMAKQALHEASRLFPRDSPSFTAALRSSAKMAVEAPNKEPSNALPHLDPKTIVPTKLDQDPRYRLALRLLFESAANGALSTKPYVYHGKFDTHSQYADVVLLSDGRESICSGVIIGNGIVLTALHCICDKIDIMIGVPNKGGDLDIHPAIGTARQMKGCDRSGPADIGIVFAPSSLHPSAGQPRFATPSELKAATSGTIVGFGNTNVGAAGATTEARGYGGVVIVTPLCAAADIHLGCNQGYEFIAGPTTDAHGVLTSDQCIGDSGGPIYVATETGLAIAGIASRPDADSKGGCGQGGIYERLDGDAGRWISSVVELKGV